MDFKTNGSTKKYVLLISIIASFLVPYISSSINIALPQIGNAFALNSIFLGWITTSYLLITGIFLIPFGKIADIYGKKKIITWGIIIFTLGSLASAFSPSGDILLLSRVIQSVGSAMIFGNVYSLIASVFPGRDQGKALSLSVGTAYVGLAIGPVLGGFLTEFFGWRSIFLFSIPFGIAAIIAVLKLEGEWIEAADDKFSVSSTSVLGLSLTGIIYGFSEITTIVGITVLVAGIVGVVMFIWLQTKVENPLIHPELLFNRAYVINNVTSIVNYGPGILTTFLLTLYLQNIRNLSPNQTGLLLCIQSVFIAIFSILTGKLLDSMKSRHIAAIGMVLTAISLTILTFLGETTSFMVIVVALAILGSGYGLSAASSTEIAVEYVEKRFYGLSSASLNTMRVVGQLMGMGVTLAVLNIFIGNASLNPSNYAQFIEGAKIPFLIFAILCYVSIYGYFIMGESNKD
ncbi:MFS transporter [Methanobacterium ferruginis]|uniref:MFS transporter n=1 Tax=Methanobacterium ferruginis TaxID=710191 RepID=UPI002572DECB|nr:MFS transporter [Methanobacterium ferruginis]BDZ67625.1 MFS transporter [Methanobacterium ferruginis]